MPDKFVHVDHETPNEDYTVKPSEAAERFHVDPKTILRWADDGFFCYSKTKGGWRRLSAVCVEAQVKNLRKEVQSTPKAS